MAAKVERKMNEVIKFFKSYAVCPECGGQEWLIALSGFGLNFENILSFKCNNCGYEIVLEEA